MLSVRWLASTGNYSGRSPSSNAENVL